MNIQEMHIAVSQGVDKIHSFQADVLLPEEIDLELNKNIHRFISQRFNTKGNKYGTGFEQSQKRIDDIYAAPRLLQRPHETLWNALRAMGADIEELSNEKGQGYRIAGIDYQMTTPAGRTQHIDVNTSSQFVTALLLLGSSIKE